MTTTMIEERNQLVEKNLGLVRHLAKAYKTIGVCQEDLVGAGNIGLIYAAERFDASMEVPFAVYARFWIKREMTNTVHASKTVPLPEWIVTTLSKWHRMEAKLTTKEGKPSHDAIAEALKMTGKKLEMVRKALLAEKSAPQVLDGDGSFDEQIVDRSSQSLCQGMVETEEMTALATCLDKLTGKEALVIKRRYGLCGCKPQTLAEIGEDLCVSRERVRQIEVEALKRIREMIAA